MMKIYQYFFSLFRPSDSELMRARKAKVRDKMTWFVIKDIGTYFLFLLVVSKLAYSEKDPHQYLFRNDMLNAFQLGKYSLGPSFEEVRYFFLNSYPLVENPLVTNFVGEKITLVRILR